MNDTKLIIQSSKTLEELLHVNLHKKMWRTVNKMSSEQETVQECRDRVRLPKAHLELNLVRNAKDKKGYYKYISYKRKTRENVELLLNGAGNLVVKDMEKAKVLNATFGLVLTLKA